MGGEGGQEAEIHHPPHGFRIPDTELFCQPRDFPMVADLFVQFNPGHLRQTELSVRVTSDGDSHQRRRPMPLVAMLPAHDGGTRRSRRHGRPGRGLRPRAPPTCAIFPQEMQPNILPLAVEQHFKLAVLRREPATLGAENLPQVFRAILEETEKGACVGHQKSFAFGHVTK